jgi:hypothetical protein
MGGGTSRPDSAVASWKDEPAGSLEVNLYDPEARRLGGVRFGYDAPPISRSERALVVDRGSALLEEHRERLALRDRPLPSPSQVRDLVEEALTLPMHWPPIGAPQRIIEDRQTPVGAAVVVGRGSVVAMRLRSADASENRWLVVDAMEGEAVRVDLPPGITLRVVEDGYGWATGIDEYDVPYLYRFEWGAGG